MKKSRIDYLGTGHPVVVMIEDYSGRQRHFMADDLKEAYKFQAQWFDGSASDARNFKII